MEKTVVIIDDSPFMAAMLEAFFSETLNFRVVAVGTNGVHAVSLYKKHRPDLLTMDLTMPVKDGKTALKEIICEFPEANILMITGQLGNPIIECIKSGAAGYVEKPLRFESEDFVKSFTATIHGAIDSNRVKVG